MKKNMMIVWVLIVLLVIALLVFITIKGQSKKMNEEQNVNSGQTEQVAKAGDLVSVNYTGTLEDGTAFDSNVDPKFGHAGQPLEFMVGAGQMIPGFDQGVLGMKVGEQKTITIPPEQAYGAAGRPPLIPPNATLIFNVELTSIQGGQQ